MQIRLTISDPTRRVLVAMMVGAFTCHSVTLDAQAGAQASGVFSREQQPSASTMLTEISSLVRWVSEITPMLRAQGNEADRNKLRIKLSSISQQLASTETINIDVVTNLKSSQPNFQKLRLQLAKLQNADVSIATSIAAIRSDLHLTGQAQTELERHASDAMTAKGIEVGDMMTKLQYNFPRSPQEVRALQDKSDELIRLVRQAEDAITGAYASLQN